MNRRDVLEVPPAPMTSAAPSRARRVTRLWESAAGLGLAAAGVLHVAAAVDHLEAGDLAVGFFLLTALAQVGVAGWLAIGTWTGSRPSPQLVIMALLGTVSLLALYLVAHMTSLLDAFAVADHGSGGHGHGGVRDGQTQIDPVTGVDFSAGMPISSEGPLAMDGQQPASGRHGPDGIGTATVTAELLALTALTALAPAGWRGRIVNGLFALGALTWGLWFTGVLG
ncbi:hypothetical protein [Geodermatophilus ruber]|uniref:hypothetical protein n=1 Tax=Geodermatophilus ruber TaxID=504800 RepID=UPI0015A4F409|nr:hypothetical protein [Geodermatophilus ruber]